jgi:catechol 2,3-dioxygenase
VTIVSFGMEPGAVRLRVADLARQREFYEHAIGLRAIEASNGITRLGAGGTTAVELVEVPGAVPRPPRTTGLFHMAILVPGRRELAAALARVARSDWRLGGASDHLVSEALYLEDAEGNGIEIYRDRPRSEWRYEDGSIQMSTLPLDLDGLLQELEDGADVAATADPGTHIGHVHLNVADLDDTEAFYSGLLGLEVTVRSYPGALFFATGGYHHHLGANTWAGPGASPPPPDSRGLEWFELLVEDPAALAALEARLEGAGVESERLAEGLRTRDPSGTGLLIRDPGPRT